MRLGNTFSTLLKYYYAVVRKIWGKKNKIKFLKKREESEKS